MAKRSGIMLCVPMEEKRFNKWNAPCLAQRKLDGERCRALITPTKILLFSSTCNEIISVPHINDQLKPLGAVARQMGGQIELDGELYFHGMSFEEISSIVSRTVNLHPDFETMEYHVFDLVSKDVQINRFSVLLDISVQFKHNIKLVPISIINTFEEVYPTMMRFKNEGYEGIILRHPLNYYKRGRSVGIMKFKPKKEDEYEIIEFIEAISIRGEPKGMLGSILCRGSDNSNFSVGAGTLTHDERKSLWTQRHSYPGGTCRVQYQHLTATNGVPRFGVCLGVELKKFQSQDPFVNPLLDIEL